MTTPLVVFDLVGPMAHFRKFYTNSSSLSYHVPPRTTLMGMVAAVLGWARNAYYDRLGLEQAALGVALCMPVRTLVQTVNLLQTKTGDWHGVQSRTQIPTEWVLPKSQDHRALLRYRVFFQHRDPGITREVARRLTARAYAYPLFLGVAYCPAWVEDARLYEADQVTWRDDDRERVQLDTVVPVERVELAELRPGLRLLPDRLPLDFNPDRTLRAIANVVWEDQARPLPVRVKGRRFRLPDDPEGRWHVFLEV